MKFSECNTTSEILSYTSGLELGAVRDNAHAARLKRNLRRLIALNVFNILWVLALTAGAHRTELSQAWRAWAHPTPAAPTLTHPVDVSRAA